MASDCNHSTNSITANEDELSHPPYGYMRKFRLYETQSNYYMIGRNISRTYWRVLKIDRLEPSELNIREDSAIYTERECLELLKRIHEGNKSTGGLKFVTTCYGIIGFIKFLGPYYMLLITKRRQIGAICGHIVYAVSKSEMIPLPNSSVQSNMVISKNENRYKKLLGMVDLTKDFFFSYSYHVMRSLQKNTCDNETGEVLYETMFVWNEFLTRGIRNILHNTIWTVALVYGFFKQATLSVSTRDVRLTLIARRSRHQAGTRYLKRGVNENGSVANDVETEQIVFEEDVPEGDPVQISSVVQNRGSIPLFWSQETSRLNIKPDIILSKRDQRYEATRLHFEDLVERYGNPIIILNLIKTLEKKPRESILRTEFANAIAHINNDLPEENHLKFLHMDLHRHSKSKAAEVLLILRKVATNALAFTGFFYSQVEPSSRSEGCLKCPCIENVADTYKSPLREYEMDNGKQQFDDENENSDTEKKQSVKWPLFQSGVLRTNCIDCLDRTNVAQYAYGLAALGQQLSALGLKESTKIDLDDPLADKLMRYYETMGDTLAHQYGGSAAHNKIFSAKRGQWKAASQSQEFFRTLQRYYSNAYMDAEKQNAINVFLGNFQPQPGKPELWELDSNRNCYSARRNGHADGDKNGWSFYKRSFSDGNILESTGSPISTPKVNKEYSCASAMCGGSERPSNMLSESTPDFLSPQAAFSRYHPSMPRREIFVGTENEKFLENDNINVVDCSNFVDLDWLSSSGNSDNLSERSNVSNLPYARTSSENVVNDMMVVETTPSTSGYGSSMKGRQQTGTELSCDDDCEVLEEYSDSFVRWVTFGETLCH